MKKYIWLLKTNKIKTPYWTLETYLESSLGFFILILSSIALGLNRWIYHYHGNNYFPPGTLHATLTLFLLHIGIKFMFDNQSHSRYMTRELMRLMLVMSLIAFATNAVQYTPFKIIDHTILNWQKNFPWSIQDMLNFVHEHIYLKKILEISYQSLDYQMVILPCWMIVIRNSQALHEYYFHLLFTVLLGFLIYYFFPTIAPASILQHAYFNEFQYATGLKFEQIHQHLLPTTNEGGLIAFPSFHTIWAILCMKLARNINYIFWPLMLNNTLLILACMLLGWHYVLDIVASILLILISQKVYLIARFRKQVF